MTKTKNPCYNINSPMTKSIQLINKKKNSLAMNMTILYFHMYNCQLLQQLLYVETLFSAFKSFIFHCLRFALCVCEPERTNVFKFPCIIEIVFFLFYLNFIDKHFFSAFLFVAQHFGCIILIPNKHKENIIASI